MKRLLLFVILLALALSLSGCFLEPAEGLYAVPQQPQDFYDLQNAIEKAMPVGGAYSPPTSGENQQAVQLSDLDGDGNEEAIVYLKSEGETPLSVCIFGKQEESYELIATVEGAGSAFDRVQYAEVNGIPGNEIVVGRKVSDQVPQLLNVYTLKDGGIVELMSANYGEFITSDLDSNGLTDVVLLRADGDSQKGIAEFYHWSEGQLFREREARLSASAAAIKRIITGKMCKNVPAVFVASEYGEGTIVTDVFGYIDGVFTNLALPSDTETSVQTVREYYVYSCDIDSDGLIELPRLIPLQAKRSDSNSENQSLICWYNLLLDGDTQDKALTYHNYSGGWYLSVPRAWAQGLTVSRSSSYNEHSFALQEGENSVPLFRIAAFTGEDREENAKEKGWQRLTEKGEVLYVCQLAEGGPTLDELREMFHFIRIDWNTGETEN